MHLPKVSVLVLLALMCVAPACGGNVSPLAATSASTSADSSTPASLVGHVVQAGTASGIASAQLTLVDTSGTVRTATTDATGAFSFDSLSAGIFSLQVVA